MSPETKILSRVDLLARFGAPREGTLVFTNGCFDLLHAGHVQYLAKARSLGDALVVALNTDASVQRLKGPRRPLVPERDRAIVMAALGSVDAVTLFDEDTPAELIAALVPDVLVKGADYEVRDIVGSDKANPTTLWTHDWHGPQLWDQSQVRSGYDRNGVWAIDVASDGKYEIDLRRWPREINRPITAPADQGKALPATKARLLIGNLDETMPVTEETVGAVFTMHLKAGPTCLQTWLIDQPSGQSRGAYYVYVSRVGPADPKLLNKYRPAKPEIVMPRP